MPRGAATKPWLRPEAFRCMMIAFRCMMIGFTIACARGRKASWSRKQGAAKSTRCGCRVPGADSRRYHQVIAGAISSAGDTVASER